MTKNPTTTFTIKSRIAAVDRRARSGHQGGVLWFTGLPSAGKSTLAVELERLLFSKGYNAYVLDGDNLRTGLNADLGFSHVDRTENIRRVGQVAALFAGAGIIAISAFISPYRADRYQARVAAGEVFREVYVKADVKTCAQRDPKGLYRRARLGEIPDFTGVSAPYEVPESPDFVVDTVIDDISTCVKKLARYVTAVYGSAKDR